MSHVTTISRKLKDGKAVKVSELIEWERLALRQLEDQLTNIESKIQSEQTALEQLKTERLILTEDLALITKRTKRFQEIIAETVAETFQSETKSLESLLQRQYVEGLKNNLRNAAAFFLIYTSLNPEIRTLFVRSFLEQETHSNSNMLDTIIKKPRLKFLGSSCPVCKSKEDLTPGIFLPDDNASSYGFIIYHGCPLHRPPISDDVLLELAKKEGQVHWEFTVKK